MKQQTPTNPAGRSFGLGRPGWSLQQKAWMITAGVLVALAILLGVAVDGVFRNASGRMEDRWVAEGVRRVQSAQQAEIDALERSARDYGSWTDTYEFMGTADPAYVENNLTTSMFGNLQIDAFLCFDLAGRMHTGRSLHDGEVTEEGLGAMQAALAPFAIRAAAGPADGAVRGAALVADGIALFAALPILRDDGSGPARGAMVHVRWLHARRLEQFRTTLNLDVSLHRPSDAASDRGFLPAQFVESEHAFAQVVTDDGEMIVHVPILDANGREVALWHLALPRQIHAQGVKARLVFYVMLAVLIVAAALVIGRLLRSMVIARLETLHTVVQKVGDTSDLSPRLPLKGSDELTELTAGINRMFDALARSETQRLLAEAERERLNSQLQQAQKMEAIGTLTGGLAHDFNNLLTSIQGSAALIRLGDDEPVERERHLRRIEQAAANGAGLVRQMMAFGRSTPAVFVPVRLASVVRDVLQLLRASLPRGIDFEFRCEVQDDLVQADAAQLQQVLINLGTNSGHAMAGGTGTLTVQITEVHLPDRARPETAAAAPGQYLRLTVTDTGCGIPSANLHRVFEPFYTTKPVGSGTGLGLAVVHGIVLHHHGTIGVESEVGHGTRFIIHLPKVKAENAPAMSRTTLPEVKSANARYRTHVLLVDDDEMVRDTLAAGLKRLGYAVRCVSGGREALDVLRGGVEPIELIVTDQLMPGMTGAEFGSIVAAERPDLPLILITGYASALNESKVKAMGFRAMLMKPVTMDLLDRTLREVCEREAAGR